MNTAADPGGEATLYEPGPAVFACHSPAGPTRVWAALTDAAQTTAYFYGLAVHSTWLSDASLVIMHGDLPVLTGRVLCARPNTRLSYVLYTDPDGPPVCLTWLLRASAGGCAIRLQVDEIFSTETADETEDTWLPVLAALQRHLAPN
jgi:uncharacterized protein YndB with AHSA1/START domain